MMAGVASQRNLEKCDPLNSRYKKRRFIIPLSPTTLAD
jgi:hypothetical protein